MSEGREGLVFNPGSHTYMYDGMRVPSVTTCLKFIDGLENVPPDRLAVAGLRGTLVHKATEQHDLGLPVKAQADPQAWQELEPFFSAYLQFLSDYRDELEIESVEERVYHPLYQYAGTADRVVRLASGDRAVIDIKTSAKLSPSYGPQLAAYQEALNVHRTAKQRVQLRYALQLKKDGTYNLQAYWEHSDFAIFRACLDVYRWRHEKGLGDLLRPSGIKLATGYELTNGNTWPLVPITQPGDNEGEPNAFAEMPIVLYGQKKG